jgi:hypothetical protein
MRSFHSLPTAGGIIKSCGFRVISKKYGIPVAIGIAEVQGHKPLGVALGWKMAGEN